MSMSSITSYLPSKETAKQFIYQKASFVWNHPRTQQLWGLANKVKDFVTPYLGRLCDGVTKVFEKHPVAAWTTTAVFATSALWLYSPRSKNKPDNT